MTAIIIDTNRDGYAPDQVPRTMTVRELVDFLEQYNDDTPIFLGFDRRYTYGGIREGMIEETEVDED